jgi:hypothetical protein
MNKQLPIVTVRTRGDVEGYTAYMVWRVLRHEIEQADLGGAWSRPQALYNYSKNGLIAKGKKGDMSVRYTHEETQAFVDAQLEKIKAKKAEDNKIEITAAPQDTAELQSAARG